MKYTAYGKPASEDCGDRLWRLPFGSAEFGGAMTEALDFVKNKSLLDPKLWTVFADQFKTGGVDDADLGWRGEYWGKMMRGACITYEYCRDEKLYSVLEDSVRDIMTAADSQGRISSYSIKNEFRGWDVWCRKYVMLGLLYFLEICGDDGLADRIVSTLRAQADYLILKTGFNEAGKINVTDTSECWEGLNSSSVLEPVVKLYVITKDAKYLEYANKIVACGGMRSCNLFEAVLRGDTPPFKMPVTKAYEMMSNIEGIIELYGATGNGDYRKMAENFASLVMKTDITVIGSAGTTHELFDHSAVRQFNPAFTGIMQETCVTVTWMKLCLRLLRLTGDAKYADCIETSAYNALLGAVNFECNPYEGEVFAFDSYSPLLNSVRGLAVGGYKTLCGGRMHWGCCVAIGAAGTGLFPGAAVMSGKNGPAVNFYMPGRVTAEACGGSLTLDFDTAYPCGDTVNITADPEKEGYFELCLRIPAWSGSFDIAVNGKQFPAPVEKGYAKIFRIWKRGDRVTLKLDVRTRIIRAADIDPEADAASRGRFALVKGPVVLALDESYGHNLGGIYVVREQGGRACERDIPPRKGVRLTVGIETDRGVIETCDYASCGRNWKNGKRMTAWIGGPPAPQGRE